MRFGGLAIGCGDQRCGCKSSWERFGARVTGPCATSDVFGDRKGAQTYRIIYLLLFDSVICIRVTIIPDTGAKFGMQGEAEKEGG
jgi:hypothetical protein